MALRHGVERADQLADLRDGDAGRLARRRHAIEQRDIAIAKAEAARISIDRQRTIREEVDRRWTTLLKEIGFARALPPGDMARWRTARDAALVAAGEHADEIAQRGREQAALAEQRSALITATPGLDPTTAASWPTPRLIETARAALARLDAATRSADLVRSERAELATTRTELSEEARDLAERRAALERERAELLEAVGLTQDIANAALGDALDAFDLLTSELSGLEALDRRITNEQAGLDSFDADLARLFQTLDRPNPEHRFAAMRALVDELDAALSTEQQLVQLAEADEEATETTSDLDRRIAAAGQDIAELMVAARVTEETALARAIQIGHDAALLKQERDQLDREIAEQGDGVPMTTLAGDAATLDPDSAAAELRDIRIRQREIEEARETIGRRLAEAEAAMSRVATEARAAEAQQDVTMTSAALAEAAEAHIRAASAAALLRWAIDRHRATNQAPLIARAGTLFSMMTRGAFAGLALDFGEDDRPRIMGARAGGGTVAVDGMSEGTRDQLFLALRLGAIDVRNSVQSIPIVCDDLLITADDGRAAEMIGCLGVAARQSQVLLFSHHEHIIEVFNRAVGTDGYRLHHLDRTEARAA